MMNEQTDRKFIFVTQFLKEAERIKNGCATRRFVSPECTRGGTKLGDIHRLIREGRNIATTHSLFISYTEDTKRLIEEGGYTLVLDESVDILRQCDIATGDIDILKKGEIVRETGDKIEWIFDDYVKEESGRFREEMLRARSNNFLRFEENFFFWTIPPELFTCFQDVYVLTYMFRAQPLCCFFKTYGIDFEYIGVRKTDSGYEYCDASEMSRALDLRDKVHILDDHKLNAVGENRTDLSFSWYRSAQNDEFSYRLDRVRKNLVNVFKNIYRASAKETLWTTFKEYTSAVRGNGYQASFVPYNMRASNEYADRKYLAYCVNNFPRPLEHRYYATNGANWDGDEYALSILVQWMFRSAIRNGEEIWIYVPSKRMRSLLVMWLDKLAEGKDLDQIFYKTPRKSRAKPGAKRGRPRKES